LGLDTATLKTRVIGDITDAQAKLKQVQSEVQALTGKSAQPIPIKADATQATASIANLQKGINATKGAAVGLISSGLMSFFSDSARAAAEESGAMSLLKNSVENTGTAYDTVDASIETYIQKMADLGVGHEDTMAVVQKLTEMTGSESKAMENVGLTMDLARAKHMDFSTAARLVGMVVEGNYGLLKRYGIIVDANATSTEALAQVQQQVAGATKAYGESSAGVIDMLKVHFEGFQETVGGSMGAMVPYIALLPTAKQGILEMGTMVGAAAGWFGKLGTATALAVPAQVASTIATTANAISDEALAKAALEAGVSVEALTAAMATQTPVAGATAIADTAVAGAETVVGTAAAASTPKILTMAAAMAPWAIAAGVAVAVGADLYVMTQINSQAEMDMASAANAAARGQMTYAQQMQVAQSRGIGLHKTHQDLVQSTNDFIASTDNGGMSIASMNETLDKNKQVLQLVGGQYIVVGQDAITMAQMVKGAESVVISSTGTIIGNLDAMGMAADRALAQVAAAGFKLSSAAAYTGSGGSGTTGADQGMARMGANVQAMANANYNAQTIADRQAVDAQKASSDAQARQDALYAQLYGAPANKTKAASSGGSGAASAAGGGATSAAEQTAKTIELDQMAVLKDLAITAQESAKAIGMINDLKGPSETALSNFKLWTKEITGDLIDTAKSFSKEEIIAGAAFAEGAKPMMDLIGPAVAGLQAITDIKKLPSAENLKAFKDGLFQELKKIRQVAYSFSDEGSQIALSAAGAMNTAVAAIKPSIEGMDALRKLKKLPTGENMKGFTDALFMELTAMETMAKGFPDSRMAAITSFADKAADVTSKVGNMAGDLSKLSGFKAPGINAMNYLPALSGSVTNNSSSSSLSSDQSRHVTNQFFITGTGEPSRDLLNGISYARSLLGP
jgi:hypothetical protein